jgi:signal transduction histidine kinase
MITKEKTIGVLEAINKIEGVFNQNDSDLLAALGAQAAVAIENSRLFQQSDLISELIHELRTPLASLNAASYLLLRPEMEEEKRVRIVNTMHREIERLSEMASSFLDLARLESGRTQFSMEQINIPAILEESVSVIRPRTEEKSQHINVEVQSDIPPLIGDRDKIKQVIINLLSNAQKYTPEDGNIRLQASANNGEVIIRVIDDGPGIDADNLPYLFEKFYRVPGAESVAPGTGLGLSICKRIVETHRGYIDVESTPGKGTTFLVTLPLPEQT